MERRLRTFRWACAASGKPGKRSFCSRLLDLGTVARGRRQRRRVRHGGTARMNPKVDPRLADRLRGLDPQAAAAPVRVLVRFTGGDPAPLRDAGLDAELVAGETAIRLIAPAAVERLAGLDEVILVQDDRPTQPDLHTSVPEIHADHVRTGALGLTGAGVVVGVVDTGIDIYHHAFRKPDGTTRIVSLLDLTIRNTITMTGTPTAGTFTLSWRPPTAGAAAQVTGNLNFDATAQQVLAALNALPAIDPGDALVIGGPLPGAPIIMDFAGQYLHKDLAAVTIGAQALTPAAAQVRVARGHEYTEADINAALTTPGMPFDSVDIEGHGTHVMGTAAGDGSQPGNCQGTDYYIGVAPNADLIAVKTSFFTSDNIKGVQHVFTTAGAKAAVGNLSLGGELGAHDGTDTDEVAFDGMLAGTTGRALVVSAGNDGALFDHAHPERGPYRGGGQHAFKHVAANGSATMDVVISPGDKVDDWFELWYGGAGRLDFQLREPGGATLAAVLHPDGANVTAPIAGHGLFISSRTNLAQNGRHRISMKIAPPSGGKIANGTWTITLTETTATALRRAPRMQSDHRHPRPRLV